MKRHWLNSQIDSGNIEKILTDVINLPPLYVVDKELNDFKRIFNFYKNDLSSNEMNVLTAEFETWQQNWIKTFFHRETV